MTWIAMDNTTPPRSGYYPARINGIQDWQRGWWDTSVRKWFINALPMLHVTHWHDLAQMPEQQR